jgi:hypothetical protein
VPHQCGLVDAGPDGSYPCTPKTCQAQNVECGLTADGCGSAIFCGGQCDMGGLPWICGGPGPFLCGVGPTCHPITCQQQGIDCGPAGDGCGNLLDCGDCVPPRFCGGGGFGKCG